jgi:hypothetical protein
MAKSDNILMKLQSFQPIKKTFNETFNDFFNNRVCGVCMACRWRVKPDSVKKCLNPCKTGVKILL